MEKINIGLFCDAFYPMIDGVVCVVDNYAKNLSKIANVTVFAPKGREEFDDSKLGYKVIRCNKSLKLSFLDYDMPLPKMDKEYMEALEEAKLDIVHIHSPFTIARTGLEYAKDHNIPIVATLHSQFKKDFLRETKSELISAFMLKNIISVFNSCNECWAVNREVAKVYYHEYGLKKFPKVQNNGTDLLPYENEEEIKKLRLQYGIKDDEKVLLFIGRIIRLKNVFFIADCLKRLKENNFKYKMIYVGSGPDFDELKEYIKELGLEKEIIFTGKIADRELLVKHYAMADLFVFPSMYDCSSLVQIEAASQHTPTIFVRGAVTSGTCTEGVDAYFAKEEVEDFSNKIMEIFKNDAEYQKIKEGAFNNLYVTWTGAVQKVYEEYLRVIDLYNKGFYVRHKTTIYKKHKNNIKVIVRKRYKLSKNEKLNQKKEEKKYYKLQKKSLKKSNKARKKAFKSTKTKASKSNKKIKSE